MLNGKAGSAFAGFPGFEGLATPGKDAMEAAMKAGMDAASRAFGLAGAAPATGPADQIARSVEEATAFSRDNVEALVAAGSVTARGVEELSTEMAAVGKAGLGEAAAAARAILGAGSFDQAMEAQTAYARKAIDTYVAETARLGTLGVRLAQQAYEPIGARMQATFDRLLRPFGT